jgi:hypothetical protein
LLVSRSAVVATYFVALVGIPVALGFLASLAFARPWTRWVALGVIAVYFVTMTRWAALSAGTALRVLAFVATVGTLGYATASLGIRLRRGRTAPQRA